MKKAMRLPVLLFAVLLTGCASERVVTEIRTEKQDVPGSLLTCRPSPVSPEGDCQRQVAYFIINLYEAGEDCRMKLGAVRKE